MFYKQPEPKDILTEHGRATQEALPPRFTVSVWNWQKCKQKTWEEEFRQISLAADLFLAQEVHLTDKVKKTMESAPYHWSGAVSFFSLKGKKPIGIATGCTARPIRLSVAAAQCEPVLRVPKMTLGALFPVQNASRPLLVINIHAINFTGLKPFAQNLRRASELLRDFNGPVLVGGDFNAWSLPRHRLLQHMAKSAGLTEVVFEPDRRSRFLGRPVDYLFVRGLTVRAAGVRVTRGSDHNPLLARLEVL